MVTGKDIQKFKLLKILSKDGKVIAEAKPIELKEKATKIEKNKKEKIVKEDLKK